MRVLTKVLNDFNPFQANVPLLYPLKTSENQMLFFSSYENTVGLLQLVLSFENVEKTLRNNVVPFVADNQKFILAISCHISYPFEKNKFWTLMSLMAEGIESAVDCQMESASGKHVSIRMHINNLNGNSQRSI